MVIEIDDRYPEFAAPYAPEGRGKRRKGLTWGGFAFSGIVLIFLAALLHPAMPVPEVSFPVPVPQTTSEIPETPPPENTPEEPTPPEPPTPPVVTQYTVTFVDWDGTFISSSDYDEGTLAADISVPADPSRANDANYKYFFVEWTPALADVTGNATYTAAYVATELPYYNVTFVDYDGTTILQPETSYAEGTLAADITQPITPTRASDGTYTYTFSGWSPDVADVTDNVIYTAVYDSEKNKYTITWNNYDGSTIDTTTVEQDEMPVHADPTYGPTEQYIYTFNAWSPAIVPAVADATYTADYTVTTRQYNVTFVDEDGTELMAATAYDYGTLASDIVQPATPTKPSDGINEYTFSGWSPGLAEVTEDATYTATYTATPITYTAPSIDLVHELYYGGGDIPAVSFTSNVTLNDVAGSTGHLKLLHYNYDTGEWDEELFAKGFEDAPADVTLYAKTSESDVGTELSPSDKNALYDIPGDAAILEAQIVWTIPVVYDDAGEYVGQRTRDVMNVAFDYELADGSKGTVKLADDFYVYNDWFIGNYDIYQVADVEEKTIILRFPYQVDRGGPLDYDHVYWHPRLSWQDKDSYVYGATGTELDMEPTITNIEVDGVPMAEIVYTFETIEPNRAYDFTAEVIYSDYGVDDANHWDNWVSRAYADDIEFANSYTAPEIELVHEIRYDEDSDEYFAGFTTTVTLNDVAGSKGQLRLRHYDARTGVWEDVPFGADGEYYASVELYTTKGGVRTQLTPVDVDALYDIPEDAEGLEADIVWWIPWYGDDDGSWSPRVREVMNIAFDYVLPDDAKGTVQLDDDFYLYRDWFFASHIPEPVADVADNTITFYYPYQVDYGGPLNYDNIYWHPHLYWQEKSSYDSDATGTEVDIAPTITRVEKDGFVTGKIVYQFETIDPDRVYAFEAQVIYSDYGVDAADHWNNWVIDDVSEKEIEFKEHRTITFVDEDGTTVLQSSRVPLGELPYYFGNGPTKESDSQYDYPFVGWDPEIVEVTEDATYRATYATAAKPTVGIHSSYEYGGDSSDWHIGFGIVGSEDIPDELKGGSARIMFMRYDEDTGTWVDIDFITAAEWEENDAKPWTDPTKMTIGDMQMFYGDCVYIGEEGGSSTEVTLYYPTMMIDLGDSDYIYASMAYHLPENPTWEPSSTLIKPVMKYEYPNGTKGTVEGRPMRVYSGSFIGVNSAYGDGGRTVDSETKTIRMDFVIDAGSIAIDPDNIHWNGHDLHWQDVSDGSYSSERYKDPPDDTHGWVRIDGQPKTETYTGSDGKTHVLVTYTLDEINTDYAYDYYGVAYYIEDGADASGVWEAFPSQNYMRFS